MIEGLPTSPAPKGLLSAVHPLLMAQCEEERKGTATLPAHVWLLAAVRGPASHQARAVSEALVTFRTCGPSLHQGPSRGSQGGSQGKCWVPAHCTSGHHLCRRLSSMFCVIVFLGKGSSQGSLTCPHAQRLLYGPLLEDYPRQASRCLCWRLCSETFSPLQSPADTKVSGPVGPTSETKGTGACA